jgi:hypothetical protein
LVSFIATPGADPVLAFRTNGGSGGPFSMVGTLTLA